ncbi:MAG: metallophosphoesterase family protein [Desulfovibrionales bacterium]
MQAQRSVPSRRELAVRIAIISDTHLSSPSETLLHVFDRYLLEAEMLLHLGDVTGEETLALFMTHPRFFGVSGNMDPQNVRSILPFSRTVRIEGVTIGMAHGWGMGPDPASRLADIFHDQADLVCFGHTHRRCHRVSAQGLMLINPGSLSLPRDDRPGFAWLHLHRGGPPQVEWQDL